MKQCSILAILLFIVPTSLEAQEDRYRAFWNKTDEEFRDPDKSPLKPEYLADFDSVARYPYEADYAVWARIDRVERQKPFTFETTGDLKQRYQKAAELHFSIDTFELSLSAYRNLNLMRNPQYRNMLFIPFTDGSNGFGTYEGGRYLEVEMVESDSLFLDFNLTYNPYCAYSDRYSCPIPPKENDLKIAIRAGAKSPK